MSSQQLFLPNRNVLFSRSSLSTTKYLRLLSTRNSSLSAPSTSASMIFLYAAAPQTGDHRRRVNGRRGGVDVSEVAKRMSSWYIVHWLNS